MTKKDVIKKLIKLSKSGDTEAAHLEADTLLLEYIKDKEITKAYNSVFKYYA